MLRKLTKKVKSNIRIYKKDIETKGTFYTITDRFHKIPLLKYVLIPLSDFFKPDFVIINNQKIYINKKDTTISPKLLSGEGWENFESEIFKKNLKKGDTVLDIGAHIGLYTLLASKIVGKEGRVYAFEPDPRNFLLLGKNIKENKLKNVTLVNKAVSNKTGMTKLYLDEKNTGDNRIFGEGKKSILVETVTLDGYLKNKKVGLIKMDVQGAEAKVLKGAEKILKKNKKIKIICEFWPKGLGLSGSSSKEFLGFIMNTGFKIYEIKEEQKEVKRVDLKLVKFRGFMGKDYTNILCLR